VDTKVNRHSLKQLLVLLLTAAITSCIIWTVTSAVEGAIRYFVE
jgi:hypothetical protein